MRASVRYSSLNGSSPVIVRIGRASMPGVRRSTSRQLMPLCLGTSGLVRTYSWHQSARWPRLFHVFWPLTTKWSPSRTADVRSEARSDPASGSDIPCDHTSSPRSIGCRKRACCSSVPYVMIAGAMFETPMTLIGPGALRSLTTSK